MPGPAADGAQVPFRNAKEEIRARVEGSEAGGGQQGPGARRPRQNIVWRNVVLMSLLHLGAVYSLALIPTAKPLTLLWAYFCFLLTALGVTAGAHRLWSHRSYKAKLPLRIFLAAANSMAFQVGMEGPLCLVTQHRWHCRRRHGPAPRGGHSFAPIPASGLRSPSIPSLSQIFVSL
uniref:stearoyl-CoA desaturase 5 n=1 Tax=Halichoerus grypus TaxID=9711 RepID=UPI001659AFC6|nr:stearoyl-CoA desaturase 5 [Halichoerus grypus]